MTVVAFSRPDKPCRQSDFIKKNCERNHSDGSSAAFLFQSVRCSRNDFLFSEIRVMKGFACFQLFNEPKSRTKNPAQYIYTNFSRFCKLKRLYRINTSIPTPGKMRFLEITPCQITWFIFSGIWNGQMPESEWQMPGRQTSQIWAAKLIYFENLSTSWIWYSVFCYSLKNE